MSAAAETAAAGSPTADPRQPTVEELLAVAVGSVPGGVERPGQQAMATAVASAAASGEHLLVQAGTGTGKSLAYLVPALLSGGPVVVATATLALQAQLVDSDLPRLVDAVEPVLGRRPTYALLKGRHHYLCLARVEQGAADDPADALFDDGQQWLGRAGRLGQQVARLREWAKETTAGDRVELDPGVDDMAWRQVSMPARECIGAHRCPFGAECFAEASRARAREADIVVTNHTMLAVDMLADRHILPDHELLVVDEAHDLVDRVTSATQAEITVEGVGRAARRLRTLVEPATRDLLDDAGQAVQQALEAAPVGRAPSLPAVLREALLLLDAAVREVVTVIGDVDADDPAAVATQQTKGMLTAITQTAQRLLEESDHDVAWVSADDRGHRALVVAPLSVAGQLGTQLYAGRTVVATSATLALGGRFDTLGRALGLPPELGRTPATQDVRPGGADTGGAGEGRAAHAPGAGAVPGAGAAPGATKRGADAAREDPPLRWRALDVGSPFDYPKQGILYVAARLPRPAASGLPEAAHDELVELVQAAGGRTLGLFSSRRAAQQSADVLRARTDLPVLVQGDDGLGHLVRRFRDDPRTCLLGVMSLWQGVDVPGPACQLVVIDRLPFPRPDDPLSAARSKAVDDAGGSGFAAVSVPVAAVKLAQGAGRLVRAAGDRGVVAVLDSRLHTQRSYGEYLRRSLPPFWYTTAPEVVRAALRRLDEAARALEGGSTAPAEAAAPAQA